MVKRVKLLPFFSSKPTNVEEPTPPLWPWPAYCQQPRTLSFRDINDTFKTTITSFEEVQPSRGTDPVEEVIKGMIRSERLFFEPEATSSILDEANIKQISRGGSTLDVVPFKESVALSMESRDPYLDFKKSMEEMVEAHRLKDSWEELQELLCCYLRVNGKVNHGYILGAFVDLLVGISFASSSSSSSSPSSSCSSSKNTNPSPASCSNQECHCCSSRNSPSCPLSFYTSSSSCSSSSYECSSSSNPLVSSLDISDVVSPCLSLVGVEIAILEDDVQEI